MLFQKALSGLMIAGSVFVPVEANEHFRDHYNLALAVESVGVDFQLNPPACYYKVNHNTYGWYWAEHNQLVVCQINATDTNEVPWTREDLDTLRHEVHHLVQDCMDDELNGHLHAVYEDPHRLAVDWLGRDMIRLIRHGYADQSSHLQLMELEAFSVAKMDDPQEQLRDIMNYCM